MLTTDEIITEYTKCSLDTCYCIERYLQVFDKTQGGFVPFKLFTKQKEIIKSYDSNRFNLIKKHRQAGLSSTTNAYLAIKASFNLEMIVLISHNLESSKHNLKVIRGFLKSLPRWVWGSEYYGDAKKEAKRIFKIDNARELELPNGSKIIAITTGKDALCGYAPTYLVMDEAAYINRGNEIFSAALTALNIDGKAILISTPNGLDSLFFKVYEQAKRKCNPFNIIELDWYEDLRFNKDLRWLKNNETHIETEFTFESFKNMIEDGWKPTSWWYEEMCNSLNNNEKYIDQEINAKFVTC